MSDTVTAGEQAWLRGVGMRVRLARMYRRESQAELGNRAGVSRVTVCSVERADHPAGVLAYVRLARAIDLPVTVPVKPGACATAQRPRGLTGAGRPSRRIGGGEGRPVARRRRDETTGGGRWKH